MKVKSTDPDTRNVRARAPLVMHALAEAQLRRASVRVTEVRVKVLAALLAANRAFSHHEIQDRFADMDRVTLYRALDFLTGAGLAHKIAGDDRVFRYSAGTDHASHRDETQAGTQTAQHQHGHFKCTRCARVFCLEKSGSAGMASDASPETTERQQALRRQLQTELQKTLGKGFRTHDIELTIKGWCADCGH